MKRIMLTLALAAALAGPAATLAAEDEAHPLMRTLLREARAALERRGIAGHFERFAAFAGERLDASAGERTFSDKTGNCRLSLFDTMLRRPLDSVAEAEILTRRLHAAACRTEGALPRVLSITGGWLDVPGVPAEVPGPEARERNALQRVADAAALARASWDRCLAPLTDAERQELLANLYEQSTGGEARLGHRFRDSNEGRRVCDLLEKLDRSALLAGARALAALAEPDLLEALARTPDGEVGGIEGLDGALCARLQTPQGLVLVGGRGPNRFDLDRLAAACAIVDLGGDDVYLEGTTGPERPVLVLIDLDGNDVYSGQRPGIQGGAVLGLSVLVEAAGNDRYEARDVAQGSCLGGFGLLLDMAGDDVYSADSRAQGQAVCGVGILIDREGDDAYRAALLSQGVGGPLGVGLLEDVAGADHYYAGGKYPGPYDDTPGYGSWSQGVGVGPRGVANGGIGVLLDGAGDDLYEYDYFAHAGAYWFALGFARDFGGNDRRVGSTRTVHDGSPREEPPFVRWGVGYGCHYGLGFLFDDAGDDTYRGDHAAVAYGWDVGVGAVCDLAGNDRYESTGSGVAQAHNAALAVLFDAGGDDTYAGRTAAEAGPAVDYHAIEQAGGNFTVLLDLWGQDQYAEGLTNDADLERGWAGGIFLDRPAPKQ